MDSRKRRKDGNQEQSGRDFGRDVPIASFALRQKPRQREDHRKREASQMPDGTPAWCRIISFKSNHVILFGHHFAVDTVTIPDARYG